MGKRFPNGYVLLLTVWWSLVVWPLAEAQTPPGAAWTPSVRPIPSGRTELLLGVTFLDGQTGFAVGGTRETGTPAVLLRTEHGPAAWVAIDTQLQTRLYDVQFPTDRVGYAVGLHGAVLKTEDRGRTWKVMPSPGDVWLASVFFTSAAVGYAVGGDRDGMLLLKTDDGAGSWHSLADRVPQLNRPRTLRDVRFYDDRTGFTVGEEGGILTTTDAGLTWTVHSSGVDAWLRAISVVDDQHVFVGGKGVVLRSSDGGRTWERRPSPGNEKINDLAFVGVKTGYATTMDGRLWWTADAGENWQRLFDNGGRALGGLARLGKSIGYAVGDAGTVLEITGPLPPPGRTSPPPPVRNGATPCVSPDGRFVVFNSNRGGVEDLFVIASDGTGLRQLTQTPEDETGLQWTADGKHILFSVLTTNTSRLYQVDPDGSNRSEIGSFPGRTPMFSPDGSRLVYSAGTWTQTRLMASAPDGSDARQISAGSGPVWNVHWAPDGRQLAFTGREDPRGELAVFAMNPDGSGGRKLTHLAPGEGGAQWPVWSPDGRQLAIQINDRREPGRAHIGIVDAATGDARKIAPHDDRYLDETPSWFPDGKRVAFQSNRTGRMEVWMMNTDGSELRQLTGKGDGSGAHN